MPDTWDSDPNTLPPLTKAVVLASPTTLGGNRIGPAPSDAVLRKLLDAIAGLEAKQISHGW